MVPGRLAREWPTEMGGLLDEILNLENLRFGRELDAHVAEDGHQLLTVSLELPRANSRSR